MAYELCTFFFSFFSLLISFFFPPCYSFFKEDSFLVRTELLQMPAPRYAFALMVITIFDGFFFLQGSDSWRFLGVAWFFFTSSYTLVFAVLRIDLAACCFSTLSTVLVSFTLCSSFFSLHLFFFSFLIYLCSYLFACSFFFWNTGSNPFVHSAK